MIKNKKILFLILFIGFLFIFTNKNYAYTSFEVPEVLPNDSSFNEMNERLSPYFQYYIFWKTEIDDETYYHMVVSKYPFLANKYEDSQNNISYKIVLDKQVETDYSSLPYGSEMEDFPAVSFKTHPRGFSAGYALNDATIGLDSYYELCDVDDLYYSNFSITHTPEAISRGLANNDDIAFFQQRSSTTNGTSSGNEQNQSGSDTERTGFFSSVGSWFNSVISGLTQGFANVVQNITSILDRLNPLSENFFLSGVINFLSTILSYINPFSENFFGYKLVDLIRTILTTIFVPDREAILSLVNNTKNKFSFIDDIKSQITTFKSFLNNINSSQTYSFTMNNKYFNGTVYIIDLSWFASLKPWTDAIITGFVYLKFLWSLFIKAPGIIAGQPMNYDFEGMRDDISVGGRLKSSSRRT